MNKGKNGEKNEDRGGGEMQFGNYSWLFGTKSNFVRTNSNTLPKLGAMCSRFASYGPKFYFDYNIILQDTIVGVQETNVFDSLTFNIFPILVFLTFKSLILIIYVCEQAKMVFSSIK